MADKLRLDRCPCGAEFFLEIYDRRMQRRTVDGVTTESDTSVWTVACTAGHTYDVDCTTNVSPHWILLPERRGAVKAALGIQDEQEATNV